MHYDGPPVPYAGFTGMAKQTFGQVNQMGQMSSGGYNMPPQSFGVACFGKPARGDGTTPTTYKMFKK